MATNTINTRIQNKYDTYANWTTNNPVPLAGELCVVVVPADAGAVVQEPAILFKVGDGVTAFKDLQFASSKAADVYNWAKAATKPTYNANEIAGLADYISGEIQDTNTQYKIEADATNGRKFYLYTKEVNGAYTLQDTIEIPETVYTLTEGTTNGAVVFNGTVVNVHGLGSAAFTDSTAYDAAGSKDAAIAAAKKAGDDAQADVDALAAKVGTVPADKTVVQMITDATYDDTELAGKLATLIGTDANKSVRTIANEELVAQLIPETAKESLDTLAEIAAWIQSHPDDASAMNAAITALQDLVGTLPTDAASATVVGYIKEYCDAAINALSIGDYAKAADLTSAVSRISTLEGTVNGLAAIAKTGNVNDLVQTAGDYLVFNCGSSSTVI